MHVKVSRKLKILRVLIALILTPVALLLLLTVYSSVTGSEERYYEKMKQTCNSEMWSIVSDSPWYHLQEVKKPYPADKLDITSGRQVVGFACTKHEAEQQIESHYRFGSIFYFLGIGTALAAPLVLIIVVWWIVEESRYWLARVEPKEK